MSSKTETVIARDGGQSPVRAFRLMSDSISDITSLRKYLSNSCFRIHTNAIRPTQSVASDAEEVSKSPQTARDSMVAGRHRCMEAQSCAEIQRANNMRRTKESGTGREEAGRKEKRKKRKRDTKKGCEG